MASERQTNQNLRNWLLTHGGSFLHDIQWPLIIFLGLASIVLGSLGFWRYYKNYSLLDSFYASLQLISMNSGGVEPPVPWELQIARFLSPLVAAYTFFFALVEIFRNQSQLFHLSLTSNHVVICGLSQKGVALVREFRKKNIDTVVVEVDEDNSAIETCREWGAIVLIGDARDQVLLLKARVNKARILIAVCDDDGINAKIAMQAKQIVKSNHRGVLTCIIHIVDPQLCRLLSEREIEHAEVPAFRLEFFNVFERGAQIIVKEYPPFIQNTLQSDKSPHILIIGLGRLGESLVLQAARNWRETHPANGNHLHISIIDQDVEWKFDSLSVRYPHLHKTCKMGGLKLDVRSPDFLRGEFLFNQQGDVRPGRYIHLYGKRLAQPEYRPDLAAPPAPAGCPDHHQNVRRGGSGGPAGRRRRWRQRIPQPARLRPARPHLHGGNIAGRYRTSGWRRPYTKSTCVPQASRARLGRPTRPW